ncbi:PB1 domain protein [Trichuris suis]|nr:PB1 domain protein [Trichuris suis]
MPEPVMRANDSNAQAVFYGSTDVKLKIAFKDDVMILYAQPPLTLDQFHDLVRSACQLEIKMPFTVKWIDEEGDPCTISSQLELNEAFRLYEMNRDSEIFLHVFPGVPAQPGLPCTGEDSESVFSEFTFQSYLLQNTSIVEVHEGGKSSIAYTVICLLLRDSIE